MSFDWRCQSEIGQERLEAYFSEQLSGIFQKQSQFLENKFVLLYFIKENLKNTNLIGEEFCIRFLLDYDEEKLVDAYRKLLRLHFGSISLYVFLL